MFAIVDGAVGTYLTTVRATGGCAGVVCGLRSHVADD